MSLASVSIEVGRHNKVLVNACYLIIYSILMLLIELDDDCDKCLMIDIG